MRTIKRIWFFGLIILGLSQFASAQTIPTPSPNKSGSAGTEQPKPEPQRIYQSACPAVLNGNVIASPLPPIVEGQCGERSPLQVSEIFSVSLSKPVILNCRMTSTLANWIEDLQQHRFDEGRPLLQRINVSTSYYCRRRNNAPSGKISEHGFANALDMTGFEFRPDQTLTVEQDWESENAETLKTMRDLACKHFTTVLSPDADPHHADHFHFDLGCHGKKCTHRLCQ